MPGGSGMPKRTSILALTGAALLLTGCGITGNLRGHPGFAPFERPGTRNADREFALSLGPLPLRMGRLLARPMLSDDPEILEILEIAKQLRAVRVYVYAVTDGDAAVRERIALTQNKLVGRGWESVVAIRDDGGFVSALVRLDGSPSLRGLAVIFHDPEEVVLVNVIGRFEPSAFGALMEFFDIETPAVAIESPPPPTAPAQAANESSPAAIETL